MCFLCADFGWCTFYFPAGLRESDIVMKKTSLIALLFLISMVILAFSSCFSFSSGGLLFTEVDGGYQVTGVSLKDRFYKNFTIEIPSGV